MKKVVKFIRNHLYIFIIISIILIVLLMLPKYKLHNFKIISIEDVDGKLTVISEKQKNAIKYVARVYDNDKLVSSFDSDNNRIPLDLSQINNGDEIKTKVTIINKLNETVESDDYIYKYNDPTFSDDTPLIITKNRTFAFDIKGEINDNYKINIIYQNNKIYQIDEVSSYTILDYKAIESYKGKLTANLVNQKNRIVSSINFYNDPVMVSDVKITSPKIYTIQKNDIILSYEGGNNATSVSLHIIKDDKILRVLPINNEEKFIKISSKNFDVDQSYKLKVVASYNGYEELSKTDEIKIVISSLNQVLPPYINHYDEKVKEGTQIILKTKTDDAFIKYTTNGKDPKKFGIVYDEPITINKNMTIKAYSYRSGLEDSPIETFDFKIDNTDRVVYLSPSSQDRNYGVTKVGFSNEMEWMNKVCDIVEKELKVNGVKTLRNNPKVEGKMNVWLRESKKANSDLHFAIHSNGSEMHDEQGMEVWVNDETSKTYSFANTLYDNLYDIYPYKSGETNRGIKYAYGSLGEVNPLNTQKGVLIEIAFHDNIDDAKWIVDNYVKIGENIAKTIIDFYQIGG